MKQLMLLLISLPFAMYAQQGSLHGIVLDKTTNEEIPFANVQIKQANEVLFQVLTDFEGSYIINGINPGTYLVEFSSLGYASKIHSRVIITGYKITILNAFLELSSSELQDIVISEEKMIQVGKTNAVFHYNRNDNYSEVKPRRRISSNIKGARSATDQVFIDGVKVKGSTNIPREAIALQKAITEGLPALYSGDSINNDFSMTHKINRDRYYIQQYQVKTYFPIAEEYIPVYENNFEYVHANPLSTFSIDVDGASYANTRRYIENGQLPPQDAVRIEEFINYFQYDYPEPEEHPISIYSELSSCPWNEGHQLLQIGLQAKNITLESKRQNLVFLLDVSGSMSDYNKLPLVKRSLELLLNELNGDDLITIVVYAGASGLALPPTSINEKSKILKSLNRLESGGSTAGGAGIELAYKMAKENFIENGNNRVILCTDGDFNVGITDRAELVKLIERRRDSGVYLSVLGFGIGNLHDGTMEQLANNGNGNYNYIDNIREAQKVFINEMIGTMYTVAKDVKLQLEFNPENVKSYRLIGYENRILSDSEFNDDLKDAGDMGANHTVTALYEIIPKKDLNNETEVDELKYASSKSTDYTEELLTVKIRYKLPDQSSSIKFDHIITVDSKDFNESSINHRFSAAVAAYGMLIRGSKHSGSATFDDIRKWARKSKGQDVYSYRSEFISLVNTTEHIVDLSTGNVE